MPSMPSNWSRSKAGSLPWSRPWNKRSRLASTRDVGLPVSGRKLFIDGCRIPEFDAAYRAAKRAAFGQATARLQQGSSAAATTMLKIMVDSNAPATARLKAADCVLSYVQCAIELEQIEARIASLEQAAEQVKVARR